MSAAASPQTGNISEPIPDAADMNGDQARKRSKLSGPAVNRGRVMARTGLPFGDLHKADFEGLRRITALGCPLAEDEPLEKLPPPPRSEDDEFDAERADKDFAVFCAFRERFPNDFKTLMALTGKARTTYLNELSAGRQYAKSTDLTALNTVVQRWFPDLEKRSKAARGFHHPATGRLLAPATVDYNDDSVVDALKEDPSLSFPDKACFPRFCFGGNLNTHVDLNTCEPILLRNPFLLAAWTRIFQSDKDAIELFTVADDGTESQGLFSGGSFIEFNAEGHISGLMKRTTGSSKSLGMTLGLTEVTPFTIAYALALLRHCFSSENMLQSTESQSAFDNGLLFDQVLSEVFASDCNQTVKANIIDWWNRHTFPKAKPTSHKNSKPLSFSGRISVKECLLRDVSAPRQVGNMRPDLEQPPPVSSSGIPANNWPPVEPEAGQRVLSPPLQPAKQSGQHEQRNTDTADQDEGLDGQALSPPPVPSVKTSNNALGGASQVLDDISNLFNNNDGPSPSVPAPSIPQTSSQKQIKIVSLQPVGVTAPEVVGRPSRKRPNSAMVDQADDSVLGEDQDQDQPPPKRPTRASTRAKASQSTAKKCAAHGKTASNRR